MKYTKSHPQIGRYEKGGIYERKYIECPLKYTSNGSVVGIVPVYGLDN
jgi:hypothetical protein